MGAAAKLKVVEREEQELSIKAIEILPDLLQVRANLDKEWSRECSKGYLRGDTFPPVLVYRLPDGRLVLTDGFHRVDACLSIGKRSIRAQIREGTIQEALLAAIEANTAKFHRGRKFEAADRRRSTELILADILMWGWSDQRVANISRFSDTGVKEVRFTLHQKLKRPLPTHVLTTAGRTVPYSTAPSARFIKAARRRQLSNGPEWLLRCGLAVESIILPLKPGMLIAIRVSDAMVAFLVEPTKEEFLSGFALLRILSLYAGMAEKRKILVGCREDFHSILIDLARQDGIEFLTLEELVASLGGTEPPAEAEAEAE